MRTKSLIGIAAGGTSIAFSSLCIVFVPVFTPAFMLAAIVGIIGGTIALALRARRTALVAFSFALTPLLFFLFMMYDGIGALFVALSPIGAALLVAVLAVADYSRNGRNGTRATQ